MCDINTQPTLHYITLLGLSASIITRVIRDNVCHTEIEHRLSSWSRLYSEFLVELNKASEDAVIDVVEKMYVVYGLERLAGTDQCRFGVGLSRSWSVQRTRG